MGLHTLPILGYWVLCRDDEDLNEEFGENQFQEADEYLNSNRKEHPNFEFEMLATVDA